MTSRPPGLALVSPVAKDPVSSDAIRGAVVSTHDDLGKAFRSHHWHLERGGIDEQIPSVYRSNNLSRGRHSGRI